MRTKIEKIDTDSLRQIHHQEADEIIAKTLNQIIEAIGIEGVILPHSTGESESYTLQSEPIGEVIFNGFTYVPKSAGENQIRQEPKMVDNRVRCARCNSPFENHHHRIPIDVKWYHTGCAEKIKMEENSPAPREGFYSKSTVPSKEELNKENAEINDKISPREEWEMKIIDLAFKYHKAERGKDSSEAMDELQDYIESLLSSSLHSYKERMRVRVEGMIHNEMENSSFFIKGCNVALRDVLSLIDNREK